MPSKKLIDELGEIFKEDYHQEIPPEDLASLADSFVDFFETLLTDKDDSNENN